MLKTPTSKIHVHVQKYKQRGGNWHVCTDKPPLPLCYLYHIAAEALKITEKSPSYIRMYCRGNYQGLAFVHCYRQILPSESYTKPVGVSSGSFHVMGQTTAAYWQPLPITTRSTVYSETCLKDHLSTETTVGCPVANSVIPKHLCKEPPIDRFRIIWPLEWLL
jgi:hypothetical protein